MYYESYFDVILEKLVEYSKDYFINIDESFFVGLVDIVSNISNRIQNVEIDNSIEDNSSHVPHNLDLKIFDIVEEFYKTLNPTLGDMARNESRHAHVYITKDNLEDEDVQFLTEKGQEGQSIYDANYQNIALEKSWDAVIVATHEIAHRFTSRDDTSIMPENQLKGNRTYTLSNSELGVWNAHRESYVTSIFEETLAIYAEWLCTDFIKEKYNIDCSNLLKARYSDIGEYGNLEKNLIQSIGEYVGLLKTEEFSETTRLKYKNTIIKLFEAVQQTGIMRSKLNLESLDFDQRKKITRCCPFLCYRISSCRIYICQLFA